MVAQSTWLPMMTPLLALVVGHFVLGSKKYLDTHLRVIKIELSRANQLLGQSFHAQGNLDQAMEEYRKCIVSTSLLEQMYNLGLDYERKRQFNKAVPVFEAVQEHDANFRDVAERLARNAEVSNAIVLGGTHAPSANGTLVVSNTGMEKPMLGRYQIDKEIGRGAMGMVYLGHDPKIGRTVAIKTLMLSQEFEGDKLVEVKERFFREAETAGRLNHPNIVTIYDVGEDQEMSYIAMDYLKGIDLLGYSKQADLLPATEVIDVIIKVADALDYAHKQKVVHRDIKPANIIYDKNTGILKVTDFGVACLTDTSKTKTGTILGSPSYMSPEQLAGKRVDGRSDLFSLGVTMYQLLSGELPFVGESLASLMYKIANEKHPDIRMFSPELPACVAKIINKALHKDIDRRFQSGSQMVGVLRRCKGRFNGS
jgi:serine/threonine-protein kinase